MRVLICANKVGKAAYCGAVLVCCSIKIIVLGWLSVGRLLTRNVQAVEKLKFCKF